jgi:hypothetical protein
MSASRASRTWPCVVLFDSFSFFLNAQFDVFRAFPRSPRFWAGTFLVRLPFFGAALFFGGTRSVGIAVVHSLGGELLCSYGCTAMRHGGGMSGAGLMPTQARCGAMRSTSRFGPFFISSLTCNHHNKLQKPLERRMFIYSSRLH